MKTLTKHRLDPSTAAPARRPAARDGGYADERRGPTTIGVEAVCERLLNKRDVLHFTLVDPDRQAPKQLADVVRTCTAFGTDAFMVGGSSPFGRRLMEETIRAVRNNTDRPVILFPSSAASVCRYADGIFFMSLLNSRGSRYLIDEQVRAAAAVKRARLRPISMAYIVVSTSRKPTAVEKQVRLDPIGYRDSAKARTYALAAEYLGMSCVYLEAGSGADRPVSPAMIRAVRCSVSLPLIVGGGIRDPRKAVKTVEAGANAVVTGTIMERDIARLESVIRAIKTARPDEG